MKLNFFFKILMSFVFLIAFSSCNEHESTIITTAPPNNAKAAAQLDSSTNILSKKKMKEWPTEIYDSTYGLITIDTNAIVTRAGECGIKIFYGWSLDHFEAKPGKMVGVWPTDYSVSNLSELRTRWGYSGIFMGPDYYSYNNATSAGYSLGDMMIGLTDIPDEERASIISQYGNILGYYVDEPADQNHSIGGIRNALLEYQLSSYLVISGYKRTYGLDGFVQASDKVLFASYFHWYEILPGVWVSLPYDPDQRPDWSDMQARYGNKFSMTWINTTEITEFDNLFGHAKNLGLTAVWIYSLDGHHTDQWVNISNAAWWQDFLRRFEQYVAVEWRCDSPDPCEDCDPDDPEAGWYLYRVWPLGSYREVYP